MASEEKATDNGDDYVKRLLTRNKTPERHYLKYRRRRSIIEAISKNGTAPTANVQYKGNPFEKEFSDLKPLSANTDQANKDHDNTYEECVNVPLQTHAVETSIKETKNSNAVEIRIMEITNSNSVETHNKETTNPNSVEIRNEEAKSTNPVQIHNKERTNSYSVEIRNKKTKNRNSVEIHSKKSKNSNSLQTHIKEMNSNSVELPNKVTNHANSVEISGKETTNSNSFAIHNKGTKNSNSVEIHSKKTKNSNLIETHNKKMNSNSVEIPKQVTKNANSVEISSKKTENANPVEVFNKDIQKFDLTRQEREKLKQREAERNSTMGINNLNRPSVGERFGLLTPKELNMQKVLNDRYDKEFEQYNAELLRQGPDEFFGARSSARVLEVIEPIADEYENRGGVVATLDLTYGLKNNLDKVPLLNLDDESAASLASEDVRDLDREIDRLLECDESVYEDVRQVECTGAVAKKGKDKGATKASDRRGQRGRDRLNNTSKEILDVTNSHIDQTYTISLPGPSTQEDARQNITYHGERGVTKTPSFLKRHTSFLLNNFRTSKFKRQKSGKASKMPSPQAEKCYLIQNLTIEQPTTEFQKQIQRMQSNEEFNLNSTATSEMGEFLRTAWNRKNNSTMIFPEQDIRQKSGSFSYVKERDNKGKKVKRAPTMPSRKNGGTLNRTLSIYKTWTQKIRQKFRRSEDIESREDAPSFAVQTYILKDLKPEVREKVEKLEKEIVVQNTLIYQTSKGAQLCDAMREFKASTERVEMERILLTASLKKRALYDEIHRLMDPQRGEDDDPVERGMITLKKIKLQLREDILKRQNGNVDEWFVLVISHSTNVWVSEAVILPISSPQLIIPGHLTLSKLRPDFRISVKIYSLKLEQLEVYDHDQKYHIKRCHSLTGVKQSKANSTAKVPNRRLTLSPTMFKIKFNGVRESSFTLCGAVDLMLYDLKLLPPWHLRDLPPQTVLTGEIDLQLHCEMELTVLHSGFLTHCVGSDDMAWNRYWCVLNGHQMLFWNHPKEVRPPVYAIELTNCVSSYVHHIDRELCPRSRTLLLETTNRRCAVSKDVVIVEKRSARPIMRHYLSFDTLEEMEDWQSKLNHVISSLRDWNVIRLAS